MLLDDLTTDCLVVVVRTWILNGSIVIQVHNGYPKKIECRNLATSFVHVVVVYESITLLSKKDLKRSGTSLELMTLMQTPS